MEKDNPTDEDKTRLRVLQSQDKATRTFVKNNQETIAIDSELDKALITNRIDNGEYIEEPSIDIPTELQLNENGQPLQG